MSRICCLLACLLFIFTTGCGESKVASRIKELNSTSIQRLVTCYVRYQGRNGYKGPKSEEELKKFIGLPQNQKGFERVGIDTSDIDALFVSDRDHAPFKVKYGVSGSPLGFTEPIIFEGVGVDGEVMVGYGGGKTKLMSPDESDKLFKSKKRAKIVRKDGEADAAVIPQ